MENIQGEQSTLGRISAIFTKETSCWIYLVYVSFTPSAWSSSHRWGQVHNASPFKFHTILNKHNCSVHVHQNWGHYFQNVSLSNIHVYRHLNITLDPSFTCKVEQLWNHSKNVWNFKAIKFHMTPIVVNVDVWMGSLRLNRKAISHTVPRSRVFPLLCH